MPSVLPCNFFDDPSSSLNPESIYLRLYFVTFSTRCYLVILSDALPFSYWSFVLSEDNTALVQAFGTLWKGGGSPSGTEGVHASKIPGTT